MTQHPFLLVFLGGGLGSAARYGVSRYIQPLFKTSFPVATLLVNVVASLVLGFLIGWLTVRVADREMYRLLIGVGFCGGLSTFSAFSTDTLTLLEQNRWAALANIVLSVILCLIASWLGLEAGLRRPS